ncbi:uncharacterized protein LOC131598486 [Vicia villosa]|uniref:uncharacterized protein LOC131598486 n=1 Tax=Vicia villosa TaxID=3911 RepID=UPI00273C520A|nr:uncharacterized protein LOC131598486 [Vicia villosa]
MANPNLITLKFSILLTIILVVNATDKGFNPKVPVIIQNDITPHPTPLNLTVHCKSKDDDLGFHTLVFGQKYIFSFRPKSNMSRRIDSIKEINDNKETWRLAVRVLDVWIIVNNKDLAKFDLHALAYYLLCPVGVRRWQYVIFYLCPE